MPEAAKKNLEQRWDQPVLLAASWSASVERNLSALPSSRLSRQIRHNQRVGHTPGLESTPLGSYFRSSEDGLPTLGPERCPLTSRTKSLASVVMVGRMADRHMRQRSFYLDLPTPLSLALHERPGKRSTGLLRGVEVQRLAHGRLPATVPRVLEAKKMRVGPRAAWWQARLGRKAVAAPHRVDVVVEEWLPGRPVKLGEDGVERELLGVVAALWRVEDVTTVELPDDAVALTRERFARLVTEDRGAGLWPDAVDRDDLGRRVDRLLDGPLRVTVGLSHGDPGLGNALRTDDGRLALVDWEDADRRVLSHDVLKVLGSAAVPPERWPGLHPQVPASAGPGALPSDQQLAVALLQFLSGWPSRTRRARRRRSLQAHQGRMHRQLTALDGLLA